MSGDEESIARWLSTVPYGSRWEWGFPDGFMLPICQLVRWRTAPDQHVGVEVHIPRPDDGATNDSCLSEQRWVVAELVKHRANE